MELIVLSVFGGWVLVVLTLVAWKLATALGAANERVLEQNERLSGLVMTTSEHYRDIRTKEIDAVVAEAEADRVNSRVRQATAVADNTVRVGEGADAPPGGW